MRKVGLALVIVVGLVVFAVFADSYAMKPPTRDCRIPVWLGDPDYPLSKVKGKDVSEQRLGDESPYSPYKDMCGAERTCLEIQIPFGTGHAFIQVNHSSLRTLEHKPLGVFRRQ